MAITKERKQELVSGYRDLIVRSKGIVLASYSGLSVKELEVLRRRVRELGGEFHVVKNRLAALALQQAGLTMAEEVMLGATAVGFAEDDPLALAKAIVDFSKESEFVRVKGGVVEGVVYDARQMQRLADMPPMPVMRSRLLAQLTLPATRVAGALSGSVRQVVTVIKAHSEQGAAAAATR